MYAMRRRSDVILSGAKDLSSLSAAHPIHSGL